MKKKLILFVSPLCFFLFAACQKDGINSKMRITHGEPFTIVVRNIDTKTINAGLSTEWVEGDAVNVFHAAHGSTEYSNDGKFIVDNTETNSFKGELSSELLSNTEYDWFVYYPYNENITSPNNYDGSVASTIGTSIAQMTESQAENGSTSHLSGPFFPMFGKKHAVQSDVIPSVQVNHLLSLIDVRVTNSLDTDLTIESVYLIAPTQIIGNFTADFTSDPINWNTWSSSTNKIVKLIVEHPSSLKTGDAADFYIGVKPFTVSPSEELVIYVNASDGSTKGFHSVRKSFSELVDFKSGMIKTLELKYSTSLGSPLTTNVADFETLNDGIKLTTYGSYSTYDGWSVDNTCVVDAENWDVITSLAPCLNGRKNKIGTLSSPKISGGCGRLMFKTGLPYSSDKLSLKIEVKDGNGEIKKEFVFTPDSPAQKTVYTFDEEVNVSGEFSIHITNLCPSQKTSNKDRTAIYDLKWTNYAE